MTIAIIGAGRFGSVLQKFLSTDNTVHVFDKTSRVDGLRECALVIFAVPNRLLREAIQQWKPHLAPDATVMDVGSVKTIPCKILLEAFNPAQTHSNASVLGTHPLFGPDSAKDSWQGHKMVFCRLQIADAAYQQVQELFRSRGVQIIECPPEQHDHMMAQTQALVHFIGRALTGLRPQEIATPDYANLLRMMEKVTHDTWELFYDMQTLNPFAAAVRKDFVKKIEQLDKNIDRRLNMATAREQIDAIDETIVRLIGERFAIVRRIGELKQRQHKPVQDPKRETELYVRLHHLAQQHGVPLEVVVHVYDYLMTESRKVQYLPLAPSSTGVGH